MSVEQVTDMSAFEDALKEPAGISHWYPFDPRYRLSGVSPPQPGDIAWCGYVKKSPHPPSGQAAAAQVPSCEQCVRLRAMWR